MNLPDFGTNPDGPTSNPDGPTSNPDGATHVGCTSYTTSSIAMMRQGKSGCYELDNVVTIAANPVSSKATHVTIYVQDSAGGDFSAVPVFCSSTSTTHPCATAFTSASTIAKAATPSSTTAATPHSVTIKGTYIKSSSSKYEEFYIDTITDNGTGTPPQAATAALSDIVRSAQKPNLWFQKVTATLTNPLKMYDWSPVEFEYTPPPTACPYWFGFGMIDSTSSSMGGAACTDGNTQPMTLTAAPDPNEVLIGTDFYYGFAVSADCRCVADFKDKAPTAASQVTGSISGILVFDVPYMATTGYQYLAPTSNTDANLTATMCYPNTATGKTCM
jgi:hypothetical protein